MKITKRERWLLAVTIMAVVVGVNYFLIVPLMRSWGEAGSKFKTQQRELAGITATIAHKPQWQQEYDELRQGLGQRSEGFQRPSDVVKKIEQVASSSGVIVSSRREMAEEDKGVYRVLPVQCTVEATTESLVRFLFALQTGAGFMSVEQLQVSQKSDNPNILRCDIQVHALAGKLGDTTS